MRFKHILPVLLISTLSSMGQSGQELEQIVRSEQRSKGHPAQAALLATPANGLNIDVIQYRAHWWLNPQSDSIKGKVAIVFRPASAPVSQTSLDLASGMLVESVRFRNVPVQFSFSGASTLNLNFGNQQLNPGSSDSLVIRYRGKPVPSVFGSFTRTQHAGNWLVYTLSEPYGAKDWWPCKQALSDKADSVDITLYTPSPNTAVANGLLVGQSESNGVRTFHWKHKYPVATYLIAVASTNYAFFRHKAALANGDSLPVDNYCYPENLAQWKNEMQAVTGMISHFDSVLSPYPFPKEKYGHTQFAFGGGMEHQTNSFMQNTNYGLQAHELVHQWFGNKITCHSWQDIWLNEGFATYLAASEYVRAGYSDWPFESNNWLNYITSEPGGSVFCSDTTDLYRIFSGRLSYAKGAMLLHMLRWKLGDVAFWQGVRTYINSAQHSYGFARTSDLISILENSSGQNLAEFFQDWHKGQGYPTIQVNSQPDADSVRITLFQESSHPSVGFFEMDVPVLLKNATSDTLIRIPFTANGQSVVLHPGFSIDSVKFDPEIKWLAKWNVNQITGSASVFKHRVAGLFPNPGSGKINWHFPAGISARAEICDLSGRCLQKTGLLEQGSGTDVHLLPSGVYLIKVTYASGSECIRFVKE